MNTFNQRSMMRPRHIDTAWPQTMQLRRAHRTQDNAYRRQQRPPIDWGLVLMLAGAIFLTVATLAYKWTGPT